MNATTAIANHLNIAESMISEIQEWAKVLWVRFVSGRPRFVSKKVVKVMPLSFDSFRESVASKHPELDFRFTDYSANTSEYYYEAVHAFGGNDRGLLKVLGYPNDFWAYKNEGCNGYGNSIDEAMANSEKVSQKFDALT